MSPPELQRGKENNPSFELKIISANDVSHINEAYKMDVYAVVSITGGTTQQKKQSAKTPIDFYGCSNPTWNHTVKFSIDEEAVQFTLTVKLFSYWLEDENDLYLGQVTISVQELLASNPVQPLTNGKNDKLKLVTYPVKVMDGSKGTLSFSYRFNPVAPLDDMSPSAPDYSLWFGQPVHPTPDPASSGHPVYLNTYPVRLGQPVYLNTDPASSGQPVNLNPDPASLGQPVMFSPQFQTTMPKLKLMLVIKSAKDIKSVSIGNDMNVYASVMIRDGKARTKDTVNTPITYCTYRNPRWDHEVEFCLDEKLVQEGRLTLVVKIIGVRALLGDKGVGVVVVSIQELYGLNPPSPLPYNGDDGDGMSLMTRDVTVSSGRKGTLSFTYKFLAEQAPQPCFMYPIQGTSGYTVQPGANAVPSNGQLPIYMPPQYHQSQPQPQPLHKPLVHTQSQTQPHQSQGYQQYSPMQPHKPQSQNQPLHHPQMHTQSHELTYQQYCPSQQQVQPQPLPYQLPQTQPEPQTQGEKPARNPQGGSTEALGLGAAFVGRVIGGALVGEMMSDEVTM
ncbi:protein SRC2 homolog [Brassica rapa]|uniref:C2 domain-containing protein n=1 Tax=Brassica campestris TaxID=3711 RepID=M4EXG9_BRACM|nr:protein SRC2 homolog [Brassica rapa]